MLTFKPASQFTERYRSEVNCELISFRTKICNLEKMIKKFPLYFVVHFTSHLTHSWTTLYCNVAYQIMKVHWFRFCINREENTCSKLFLIWALHTDFSFAWIVTSTFMSVVTSRSDTKYLVSLYYKKRVCFVFFFLLCVKSKNLTWNTQHSLFFSSSL